MKTKVFISQPMQGKSKYKIERERRKLVLDIESQGFKVIDSVIDIDDGVSPMYYLAKAIEMMVDADIVLFMPGWENARGCQIEHEVALKYGKYVREL